MARWRLSGLNWEGRAWKASAPIVALANQLNALYPVGATTDGTVASRLHDANSPTSDHRPHPYSGPGIVRAIDIGGGEEVDETLEAIRLSRDSRVRYAIRYGRIFTSYPVGSRPAWQWGPYSGDNPHKTHGHLSVLASADGDGRLWNLGDEMASSAQKMIVDIAANLGWIAGDPNYWYNLDEGNSQWDTHFRPAISRGAQDLFNKLAGHPHGAPLKGDKGDPGAQGKQGIQGVKGDKGDPGDGVAPGDSFTVIVQ